MTAAPGIAIFPWGDVIEEFLEPIGLGFEDIATQMTGGWLFGYVAALQLAGWRPFVVCASDQVSVTQCLTHAATGVAIWIVPGRRVSETQAPARRSIERWLATPLRAFRKVLEAERCRALIIQEYEYTRFDALVRLARRLAIPAYASFQGGDQTLSWAEAWTRGSSLRLCAGLIIASSSERARVEHRYAGRHPPLSDIPNPIDAETWRATDRRVARQQLGIDADSFVVINHGRIDIARKGLDVLLAAWARCRGGELVILGSGQDHAAFGSLLTESGLRNVRWLSGYTTDRELIRRWLSAADVYVSASRIEGMPVAPLEAMACGLPVVATNAQGLPDIFAAGIKSGGIVVPRDDPAALAAGLGQLHGDTAMRLALGIAARQRVEAHFALPVVAKLFSNLLGNARLSAS